MKISVHNFKTITDLEEFEIKPLNILSGVNSSGKSSLIQFILLLKQTLELKSVDAPLVFNSDFIELGSFAEIVANKDTKNKVSFSISLDNNEFDFSDLDVFKIKQFEMTVKFAWLDNSVIVENLELRYDTPGTVKKQQILIFHRSKHGYEAKANTGLFNNDFYQMSIEEGREHFTGDLLFTAFFPQTFTTEIVNPDYPDFSRAQYKQYSIEPDIERLRDYIQHQFKNISYLGPLREKPSDSYKSNKNNDSIGVDGKYSAYILEKEASKSIRYYKVKFDKEGLVTYHATKTTLLEAVNYWICAVFNLAKNIYAEELQEEYVVKVVNHFGIETTIKHVGFGISQILPIVVEGLRMESGGMLILEQPEIHLHPKVQSLLFDFLFGLTLNQKRIIVETHSDNLIIRMRRRIAEDQNNSMISNMNLIFVEERDRGHVFRNLDMTDLGSLTYFPKDFVEQQDDYRAIVKAQVKKKSKP